MSAPTLSTLQTCFKLCDIASHMCSFCLPGKIKDVLAQGVVDNMTRLVLVNAIYFKGNWNKQFKESATRDAQFRLNKVTLLKESIQWTDKSKLKFGVFKMIQHGSL